jgi:hypothetical protein
LKDEIGSPTGKTNFGITFLAAPGHELILMKPAKRIFFLDFSGEQPYI